MSEVTTSPITILSNNILSKQCVRSFIRNCSVKTVETNKLALLSYVSHQMLSHVSDTDTQRHVGTMKSYSGTRQPIVMRSNFISALSLMMFSLYCILCTFRNHVILRIRLWAAFFHILDP